MTPQARWLRILPLVSVIIPSYNRAHTLGRAVDSVLAQSFRDFELIVVDDGSGDSTAELAAHYGSKLKYVFQENRGPSAARNTGVRHSSGELAAFLDSDDEWLPEKLAKQVALYDGRHAFVCHTDETWLRDGRRVPQKAGHRKQGGHFFERALERCLISPSSVVISRSLLDEVGGFDEDLRAAEDYDLWLRITAFHEVSFVPEPLVVKHGGSPDQLSLLVPAIDRFRIRAIMKIMSDRRLPPAYRFAAGRELRRKCGIVAAGCMKRGNTEEAEFYRELARSYEDDPSESVGAGS